MKKLFLNNDVKNHYGWMSKILIISLFFVGYTSLSNAQQYIVVNQACAYCGGYGVVASPYGPMYCPNCGGTGVVQVTVPNPNYNQPSNNRPSFKSENSDGYIRQGEIYLTRVVSKQKDKFILYTKGTNSYVKHNSNYIKLSGKTVKINKIEYYTGY